MNYTGYIPQYDNPELNTIDKLLRISGLIIAPFNLFLVTCFVLLTKSDGKRFHKNFCIIRFYMLIAFYLISVPPFPLYIVVNSSEIIIYSIMSISDIVGLIAIQKLGKYNKELRKITLSSNVVLSQRYQICENIRALQLLYPIFLMGICLTACGTVIKILTTTINELKWIFRYSIVAYYDLFNLYVFVALIIWLKKDPVYCKKVRRLFRPTFQNRNSTITPTSTFHNKQLVIKDVEGKCVMTDQTIEVYFSSLNQIWNNPNMKPKSPT
uniref:Uncharacterized protein n=1 Tax=Acrobeloides nanus TaxID=290746 RepID=A0A914BWR6_9BILA